MTRTLLNIGILLLTVSSFAQVPVTTNDSLFNDSIFFENEMAEVVVIGYGTRKAGSITGSVARVKASDIVRTPAQSAIQAIQGKAAGVNIVTNDEPGANPTIRIRGLGTVTQSRDPLYVIDGVEATSLNGLNPNDIATIDILKDASSLAIYGQKGANGVIIITTKKGKPGEFRVNYDGYYGQKFVQKKVDMADSYRFAYYNNIALGSTSYYSLENQPYNTDWFDEITQTGEVMNNSISFAGGGENTNTYFSASNYKEKGILRGTQFERTNVLSKTDFRVFDDRLKITPFVNLSIEKNTPKPLSAFTNAYKQSPIVPVKYENGRWGAPIVNDDGFPDIVGDRFNNVDNPVAQLYYTHAESRNVVLTGSLSAELKILDELKFNSSFGATATYYKSYNYNPNFQKFLQLNPAATEEDFDELNPTNPIYNTLTQTKSDAYQWNWDNFVTYSKLFGEHDLTVVAGMSRTTRDIYQKIEAVTYNVPEQPDYWSVNMSQFGGNVNPNTLLGNSTTSTPVVSIAYFARAEYEYNRKYLLTAIVRREGISSFLEDKRWDVFPSISAGWVVTNENFMSDITFLNYLKLRGGYGEVGNGYRGSGTGALNTIRFEQSNYSFNNGIVPGIWNPVQPDPNLTWEVMKEIDFGFDFTILSNRLSGTFDIYNRKSSRLILPIQAPEVVSPRVTYINTGEVMNKGIEVTLKWEDELFEGFRYWVSGNYSHNKNELTKVASPLFAEYVGGSLGNGYTTKQVLVGQPLGSFYVYDVTGINPDGALTYSDQRVVAGSFIPTSTYGANIGATYKGIDFSVDIYGVGGNKIYNGKKAQRFGGENVEYELLDDLWTPSTPNAANPKPFNDPPLPSTYYIEDGSYLRINNITLGYTLPQMFEKINRVRVYVTAVNPFLFTDYSGYSPEIVGNEGGNPLATAGIELDAYPTNKTFLFGINIGL